MSHLGVDFLVGGYHDVHDSFVRTYLKTELKKVEDCVEVALLEKLVELRDGKPQLVTFVVGKMEDRSFPSATRAQRIHHLALYILLTQYPEEWKALFKAAYDLLVGLLDIICKMRVRKSKLFPTIYPPKWTQQIFRLEKYLAPNDLHGIVFGVDPISKESDPSKAATGYAFTFDCHLNKEPLKPSSTKGLQNAYCLAKASTYKSENGSRCLEEDPMKPHGIGMVNFIRTIRQGSGSDAGSKNKFKEPWISYNHAWLTYMHSLWGDRPIGGISAGSSDAISSGEPRIGKDRVLIFQNEYHKFDQYSTSEKFMDTVALLTDAPRCSHPSYVRAKKDHCLLNPKTFYHVFPCPKQKGPSPTRSNKSVTLFVTFLHRRGAQTAYHCQCIDHRDIAQEVLRASVQATMPRDSESDQESDDLNQTGNTTTLSTSDLPIEDSFAKMGITDSHSTNTSTDNETTDQPSPDTSTDVVFAAVESPDISAIENDDNDDNQMPEGSEDSHFDQE